MAIDLVAMRADTAAILADWAESVTLQRATFTSATNTGGSPSATWATSLATQGDFQPASRGRSRFIRTVEKTGKRIEAAGDLFLNHGVDVQVGDRMRWSVDGELYFVAEVLRDEDKTIATMSKKANVNG